VDTSALHADHRCRQALRSFAVTLQASAQAFEEPAALLRGEQGRPAPLALDLVWDTDGVPYSYRLTSRYEIPCLVSGEIRAGEQVFRLVQAPGQRDHSWGVRDWWSMDWMWSAARLYDGTRLHAVELRLPGAPGLGVGYVQSPGGELLELDSVSASEHIGADGLIKAAVLQIDPPGLELEVQPLAFAPLRLIAPDGRVSHFPRAMCRLHGADGRGGLGWLEWNRNQPPAGGR
jgi:hypothetical protein